jgi:tryptophan synthase alpha chain
MNPSTHRVTQRLTTARAQGHGCLVPYLTAGFPDLDATVRLLERLSASGCPVVEIGVPFSDSIADGPVIQDSFYRALSAGFRVKHLFDRVAEARDRIDAALVAMVSMSIVRRMGAEVFLAEAAAGGFDGIIVPDVPVDECGNLSAIAAREDLCNVLMIAPTSSPQRLTAVATLATGFIYLIAARGITGERTEVASSLPEQVKQVRALTSLPVLAGFGISTPEQVSAVCSSADGAIVGSAIVRRMLTAVDAGVRESELVQQVGAYVDTLLEASRQTP